MYVYVGMGMCHDVYMPPTYSIRGHQNTAGGGGDPFLSFYCGYRDQTQAFRLAG